MKTEYVIFGIAPGDDMESLLVSERAGIKSMDHAERVKETLERDHGCTACRVHVFNWEKPDFAATVAV